MDFVHQEGFNVSRNAELVNVADQEPVTKSKFKMTPFLKILFLFVTTFSAHLKFFFIEFAYHR